MGVIPREKEYDSMIYFITKKEVERRCKLNQDNLGAGDQLSGRVPV
jgi:hypothetical protein